MVQPIRVSLQMWEHGSWNEFFSLVLTSGSAYIQIKGKELCWNQAFANKDLY
jgi:hypothetical protein